MLRLRLCRRMYARAFRHAEEQELHLIGEDLAIAEDECFVPVRSGTWEQLPQAAMKLLNICTA